MKCECGAPLADGGPVGLYCTNKECPVERQRLREFLIEQKNERVHMICKAIRKNTWADERKALCHECPPVEETPYGRGTRGCYLLARDVFNIAVHGDRLIPECPYCHGNDRDAPCAYPSEGKPGCLRDKRLAAR